MLIKQLNENFFLKFVYCCVMFFASSNNALSQDFTGSKINEIIFFDPEESGIELNDVDFEESIKLDIEIVAIDPIPGFENDYALLYVDSQDRQYLVLGIDDIKSLAQELYLQGIKHYKRREYTDASQNFSEAAYIYQEIDDAWMFAYAALNKDSSDHHSRGSSLWWLSRANMIFEDMYEKQDSIENNLSLAYAQAKILMIGGDHEASIELYQRILSLFQSSGVRNAANLYREALILEEIGVLYGQLAMYRDSSDFYEQALSIYSELEAMDILGKYFYTEKAWLNYELGVTYNRMHDYQSSIDRLNKSIVFFDSINDDHARALTLGRLSSTYNLIGEFELSLKNDNKSLSIFEELGDRRNQINTIISIGITYFLDEKYEKALEKYHDALRLFDTSDDNLDKNIIDLNVNMASAYSSLGRTEEAIFYYEKALSFYQKLSDQETRESSLHNSLGVAYRRKGDYQEAIKYFDQALNILKEVDNQYLELHYLVNRGHTFFLANNLSKAERDLSASMEIVDGITLDNFDLDDDLKISLFDNYYLVFKYLQKVLIQQKNIYSALEVSERGRSRALLDLFKQRFADFSLSDTQKINIEALKNIARSHQSSIVTYSLIPTEIKSRQWQVTELYIWVIHPNGNVEFRSVNLTENDLDFTELLNQVRRHVTFKPQNIGNRGNSEVAYTINDFKEGDYVHTVKDEPNTPPWQVEAIDQENKKLRLSNRLNSTSISFGLPDITEKVDSSLQELHQVLIEPIADLLPTDPDEKVIFIPQDELFLIPFPALQDQYGTYLIDKHTILTAPSIQVLSQTAAQRERIKTTNPSEALVVGVGDSSIMPDGYSDLPNVRTEAENIAKLLKTKPLLDEAASEATILEKMPQASILHFATHGEFSSERGLDSSIVLRRENRQKTSVFDTPGKLTAEEIFDYFEDNPLNAKIAVLSACDTGQGEITGDGVIGLSRSLISAGVPSVLVSLWSVDDESTAKIMEEFYRQWLEKDVDKATALRNAMLELRKEYPDPYYWAAFNLIGEAE